MDTTVIIIIILAILGTGILWVMRSSEGSFGWQIKTSLFTVKSQAKGPQGPTIEQTQNEGEENTQTNAGRVTSKQMMTGGKGNKQQIGDK